MSVEYKGKYPRSIDFGFHKTTEQPLHTRILKYIDWEKEYWDVIYKRNGYGCELYYQRELNKDQAARIMELEQQVRFHRERWQALKPELMSLEAIQIVEGCWTSDPKNSRYYREDAHE